MCRCELASLSVYLAGWLAGWLKNRPVIRCVHACLWTQVEQLTDRLKSRLAEMDGELTQSSGARLLESSVPDKLNSHLGEQDLEWFRATLGPSAVITDPERLAAHNTCVGRSRRRSRSGITART
jgi:hypothetical protein